MDTPSRILFGILVVFGLGFWVSRSLLLKKQQDNSRDKAEVVLEQIKQVSKLITVEGYFTEVYDHEDYWAYDVPLFRKKALMRVKARVSAGYDLSNMKVEAFPDKQTIVVSNVPRDPQIFSIDHDLDYYDISEGVFNSFNEADYTRLNKKAKDFIAKKAKESSLLPKAREQGNQVINTMRFMTENIGWTFEIQYTKTENGSGVTG